MSSPLIEVVVEPLPTDAAIEEPLRAHRIAADERRTAEFERFAQALRQVRQTRVEIVSAYLREVSPRGFVVLAPAADFETAAAECSPERRHLVLPRTVLVAAQRGVELALLEKYRLAAVLDHHGFFQWSNRDTPDDGAGAALFGLRSVAQNLEADYLGAGPFASEHYCSFSSGRYQTLPELLVGYLKEYVKVVPLSAPPGSPER